MGKNGTARDRSSLHTGHGATRSWPKVWAPGPRMHRLADWGFWAPDGLSRSQEIPDMTPGGHTALSTGGRRIGCPGIVFDGREPGSSYGHMPKSEEKNI